MGSRVFTDCSTPRRQSLRYSRSSFNVFFFCFCLTSCFAKAISVLFKGEEEQRKKKCQKTIFTFMVIVKMRRKQKNQHEEISLIDVRQQASSTNCRQLLIEM
jgi:hypothetical protein